MSKKNIKEILCENCKMNCKNLANNSLVFNCFFNHNDADALLRAWNFCASQYESEVEGLKLKFSEATKTYTDDIDRLEKENDEIKKKLEEAVKVIEFYGDPEKWMIKTSEYWTKASPKLHGDAELIKNYNHPNKDWLGSITVGGRMAREFLKGVKDGV